jgi:hypothetical protein
MANARYWARIVVIDVLLRLNFAANLKTRVSLAARLQLISSPCLFG